MATLVTGGAAELQFLDDGVAGLGELGDVVVLEQGGGSAVDADPAAGQPVEHHVGGHVRTALRDRQVEDRVHVHDLNATILHLLGFDHADPEEEKEMFTLQRKLLLTFLATR